MKTTFTVRFTVDDETDEPIAPEIALLDMLKPNVDQWVEWEIVKNLPPTKTEE